MNQAEVFHVWKAEGYRRIALMIRRDPSHSFILGRRLTVFDRNPLKQHPRPRVWAGASIFQKINREMSVECQAKLL